MSLFIENPLAIVVLGGVLATLAGVVFLARRSGGSLLALVGVIAITLLLLVVERMLVSDAEQVEYGVEGALAAVEANNLEGVLAWIDPAATDVRGDVEALMPLVKVEKARSMGTVNIQFNGPAQAVSSIRAFLDGVHGSSGMRVAYFNERVDINWVKVGDRWLINGYTAYYNDEPINAVSSARSNRPVPGR